MPLILTPRADEPVTTKKVAPVGWDIATEYFVIKSFTHERVRRDALAKATKTVVERGRAREEVDNELFLYEVLRSQVVDWHVFDPMGNEIKFNEENLRALPWDVKGFLWDEIQLCGGIVPTENLVVRTDSGTALDYKSQDAGVGKERTEA